MRTIKYIAIHCTATPQTATVESIQKYWKEVKGWSAPGYHYLIKPNGEIVNLLPVDKVSNGVQGFNSVSINIAYIGGVEGNKAVDNRTYEQKESMATIASALHDEYPNAIIQGHRDFPNVHKDCPSFDVKKWLNETGLNSQPVTL